MAAPRLPEGSGLSSLRGGSATASRSAVRARRTGLTPIPSGAGVRPALESRSASLLRRPAPTRFEERPDPSGNAPTRHQAH